MYVVPTVDLLYQTTNDLTRYLGMTVGLIGDGHFDAGVYVNVATIQTLHAVWKKHEHANKERLKYLFQQTYVLFMDEAHHLGADSYYKIANAIPAYYKFGLTGTAFRSDESGILLRAATGKVIAQVSSSELIQAGVLAKVTVKMIESHAEQDLGTDWNTVYWLGIVRNDVRNSIIKWLADGFISEGKSVLIIVKLIEHGRILNEYINDSVFMHGSVETPVRRETLQKFRDKEIMVLIGTKIYDEGVDIPTMDALVLAAGGLSPVKTLQRVGRALRRAPGKTEVTIVDFMDSFHKVLKRHSRKRLRLYKEESEFVVEELDCADLGFGQEGTNED